MSRYKTPRETRAQWPTDDPKWVRCQQSYSVAWNGFPNSLVAKANRDEGAKHLATRAIHGLVRNVKRSSLPSQTRKYWGLMDPCGITCTVYYVEWEERL